MSQPILYTKKEQDHSYSLKADQTHKNRVFFGKLFLLQMEKKKPMILLDFRIFIEFGRFFRGCLVYFIADS